MKRSKEAGFPPGVPVQMGDKKIEKTRVTMMDYDEMHFKEREIKTLDESLPFKDQSTVTWVDVEGIHQVPILEKLGERFGLHPLVVEDILNMEERPKMEDFGDYTGSSVGREGPSLSSLSHQFLLYTPSNL